MNQAYTGKSDLITSPRMTATFHATSFFSLLKFIVTIIAAINKFFNKK